MLLALVAGAADVLAGVLATAVRLTRVYLEVLVALGAGFILAAALLDLVPEVVGENRQAGPLIALGYLTLFLTENAFSRLAHPDGHGRHGADAHGHALVERPRAEEHKLTSVASGAALLGLTVHAYFDGVAVMSGFGQATGTGLLIFLAVLLHKLPEGFSLAAIVLAAGGRRRTALLATGVLGAATFLGGLTVAWFGEVEEGLATAFLAFAAGTFLYVGATDLIPAANSGRSRVSLPLVIVGFAVFYVLTLALRSAGLEHM